MASLGQKVSEAEVGEMIREADVNCKHILTISQTLTIKPNVFIS